MSLLLRAHRQDRFLRTDGTEAAQSGWEHDTVAEQRVTCARVAEERVTCACGGRAQSGRAQSGMCACGAIMRSKSKLGTFFFLKHNDTTKPLEATRRPRRIATACRPLP
eukprot:CAMPEP_0174705482 /NCGR_PEP_ID=MMETSP1094-20130205/8697_1 /TAXON_ID=156173 /ORGANISM="Chrysochromulina brevifilum, Strain UTEX LB 985" /LENGTH=108 /DNA_ID=CAMNT_0015903653 /DNA_START=132 /DNA_END=458 /DNA_ORIENTATION=+